MAAFYSCKRVVGVGKNYYHVWQAYYVLDNLLSIYVLVYVNCPNWTQSLQLLSCVTSCQLPNFSVLYFPHLSLSGGNSGIHLIR